MRQRSVLSVGVALIAASLALTACGGNNEDGGGGGGGGGTQTVKIGFMGDLTGENSAIVIPPKNGAQLAVDEHNAKNPKVKIQLVTYDSQADPGQAVALAQKAITQDKIVALIGPAFSGESKNVGPILEEAKIPSVSPSATNPGLAKNGWKFWHRVVANDDVQGPAIAEFLFKAKSPKTAYVIDDRQDYSLGIANAAFDTLKGKGVSVQRDHIDPKASDYSSTVNKVNAAKPDVIFYGGYYAQAGRLLKQLRDAGVQATFASGDGSLDQGLVQGAGPKAAEGAVVGCPCLIPFGSTEPTLKKFADDYKAKFKADPAIYSTEGYDAASTFVKAIEAGKTTAEDINTYLSSLDLKGVSKEIKFGPNGEPNVNQIFIYQVQGGKISTLGDSATAKLT